MKIVENQTFDEERALYGIKGLLVKNCSFDGPADGESALKESADVVVEHCLFNLRYPFWHNHGLKINDSEMTELCRAALWYSDHIEINDVRLHGIKALRECAHVKMHRCDIISPEFGWSVHDFELEDCTAQSEYFMMRSDHLTFKRLQMKGKYSFQYIEDCVFESCTFDTKDAFWHAKNVVVPAEWISGLFGRNEGFGVLMAATIGVPMYMCGGGTIPLLQEWLLGGMSMGSAGAFMITGPATKLTNLGAMKTVLGGKHFLLYILFSMGFALITGLVVDWVLL